MKTAEKLAASGTALYYYYYSYFIQILFVLKYNIVIKCTII